MPSEPAPSSPLEQLIELLVYAPVGLIYEYQEVMPRLVKRGKSQVQLARLLSRMAANRARPGRSAGTSETAESAGTSETGGSAGTAGSAASAGTEPSLAEVAAVAWSILARAITELGANVGLAPDAATPEPRQPSTLPAGEAPPAYPAEEEPGPLPIAGYDELTARAVVGLLGGLTAAQRDRVRAHERANRSRKTVLAKLDQLEGASG